MARQSPGHADVIRRSNQPRKHLYSKTSGGRCDVLDTNVILRGLDRNHPMYRVVRRAIISLRRQDNQLYLASQNLIEFWSVATRP